MVGWELNIISSNEAEAKERVVEAEFQAKLMDNLSINESEAESLIRGGFLNFDDIAYAEDSKLLSCTKAGRISRRRDQSRSSRCCINGGDG